MSPYKAWPPESGGENSSINNNARHWWPRTDNMNDAGLGLEIVGASVAQKTTVAGALAGAVGW
jgi:hypothetical protein